MHDGGGRDYISSDAISNAAAKSSTSAFIRMNVERYLFESKRHFLISTCYRSYVHISEFHVRKAS